MSSTLPCRACGRPVKLIPTIQGWERTPPTLMPLDPDPVENGNVVIEPGVEDKAIPPRARTLKKGEEPPVGVLRYVSHFATCTDPGRFRKR